MSGRARPNSLVPRNNALVPTSPQSGPPRIEPWAGNDELKKNNSKRTMTLSAENRFAAAMFVTMTLLVCMMLGYRDTPLYSARIPPLHARPSRRHRHHKNAIPPYNNNQNVTLAPTLWDPFPCEVMVERTKRIKLVALDFDKTIVDIHTGGRWKHSAKVLSFHVRPSFQCLISHCLEEGINVAVTTFSRQTDLIQHVLYRSLRHYNSHRGKQIDLPTIPVFGGDDWVEGRTKGKQSQLLLAMEHYNDDPDKEAYGEEKDNDKITAEYTLLIDDDRRNIEVAERDGYQTILYPAAESEKHHHKHHKHSHRRQE